MTLFAYKGRDTQGVAVSGELEAASKSAVAGELLKKGITPLTVEESTGKGGGMEIKLNIQLFKKKVGLDELIIFCRQMFALTKSGIPIIRAMRGLADSTTSDELRDTLNLVSTRLESGQTLATSMNAFPDVFDNLFISMIHVGENTGLLEQSFLQLAKSLELERDTRRRVSQATRYPKMVVGALGAALTVINIFVIPKFASVFAKLGADLPVPTKILMATSSFFINYWWLVLVMIAGAIYAFKTWIKTDKGHYEWDRMKLRMPVVGALFEKVTLSRFSRNFAMMLGSGLPITSALGIAGDSTNNKYVSTHINGMRTGIERGDSLLRTASATGMFTPLVLQMLAVGEETGAIDKLLNDVADFYDEEADYALKRLSESIEPILIVGMGVLVLILALGVFLPIWDLGRAAMHH
jgi:MSHA biogenesis protein MshG